MKPWLIWIIVAFVMLVAEIFTPGFLLACLGLGCLASGIFALVGAGLSVQVIVFITATLVVFFGIRPFILKRFYKAAEGVRTNVDALVGRQGMVIEPIDTVKGAGRVVVAGENWRGATEDNSLIPADTRIVVARVEGTKLIIKPLSSTEEE